MEIPLNYVGDALIQIVRIHSQCYSNHTLTDLSKKEPIVRKVSNYGTNKTFLQLLNVNLQIIYCNNEKIYESINMDLNYVFLIKVIKLI
jgi:hypothetical protein